jgi:3'-5' exonuclease
MVSWTNNSLKRAAKQDLPGQGTSARRNRMGRSKTTAPFSLRRIGTPNLIAWDVKTVPDLQVFAEVHGLTDKSDGEIREAMGDEASSPIYRSIICLGRLIAHFESDRWVVDSLYAWHTASQSEKEIIKEFFDTISDVKPRLVTFDGSTILQCRAMRHKLATPSYSTEPCNLYAIDDMSLCDVLSPSSKRRITLGELCCVLGVSFESLDDAEIEKYVREKRVREIAEHCERKVVNIFRIWLRYELYNGRLSYHGFRRSETDRSARE